MKTSTLPCLATVLAFAVPLLPSETHAAIAYAPPVSLDVADFKPTSGDVAFGFPTSNGNDGNTGTFNHADNTNPAPNNPFWEVNLQGSFNLTNFVVTDRIDCCDPNRLNGSTITLFGAGNAVVGSEIINGITNGTFGSVFNFDNGGAGYIGVERVRIDGSQQYFQFSEFDAFAGLFGPPEAINWAQGAATNYYNASNVPVGAWPGQPASFITDGNFTSFSHPLDQASGGYYAEIDLGQSIFIDSITMTGRGDCCPERLFDYQLQFLDAMGGLLHTINHAGGTVATETIDVIGGFGGLGPQARFVRVVNANGADYGPQIAELEVFGVIPEPSSLCLLGLGGLAFLRRRR